MELSGNMDKDGTLYQALDTAHQQNRPVQLYEPLGACYGDWRVVWCYSYPFMDAVLWRAKLEKIVYRLDELSALAPPSG